MNRHETLHIKFDAETVAELTKIAWKENRTRNNTVKTLVREALSHRSGNDGQSPEFETVNQITRR